MTWSSKRITCWFKTKWSINNSRRKETLYSSITYTKKVVKCLYEQNSSKESPHILSGVLVNSMEILSSKTLQNSCHVKSCRIHVLDTSKYTRTQKIGADAVSPCRVKATSVQHRWNATFFSI